ncbi:MAG: ion transporter [Thiolinea sp.]
MSGVVIGSMRRFVYNLFEHPTDTRLGRWVNAIIVGLILLNVVATVFESEAALYQRYQLWFDLFELISVLIFTMEYLLRVWVSVEEQPGKKARHWQQRLRYMLRPIAIIDAIAIIPYYLGMFFALDLRFMRFFRLLRIFKLARYSRSLDILLTVLRKESQSFIMTLSILFTVLLLAAGGIHIFERDLQPDVFGSIPKAMWWAVATLTTVGYGDVTPLTSGGKVFGSLVMIIGIGMVALPTGILSSAFSEEIRYRRDLYQSKLKDALADGLINHDEALSLRRLRNELDIPEKEAREMIQAMHQHKSFHTIKHCPTCGQLL